MIDLHHGDCLDIMPTLEADSVDTVICDPPYGLSFMGKDWDHGIPGPRFWREALRVAKPGAMLLAFGGTRTFHRLACAIEDAGWELRDTVMYVYGSGFPKSHNLEKALRKTSCQCTITPRPEPYTHEKTEPTTQHELHSMRYADVPTTVENGTGDSQLLQQGMSQQSASVNGQARAESKVAGREQSSVEGRGNVLQDTRELYRSEVHPSARMGTANGASGRVHNGASIDNGSNGRSPVDAKRSGASPEPRPGRQSPREPGAMAYEREPQESRVGQNCDRCGKPVTPQEVIEQWAGYGSALKPAFEPVIVAMKPLDGTFAQNALQHGVAGLWIDGARVGMEDTCRTCNGVGQSSSFNMAASGDKRVNGSTSGRWPANLIHDGSAEVLAGFPVTGPSSNRPRNNNSTIGGNGKYNGGAAMVTEGHDDNGGSAARFFYCAKASRSERNAGLEGMAARAAGALNMRTDAHSIANGMNTAPRQNHHPTVKPVALMRYLARLTKTPTGGVVLDPFMGSGSTGIGAVMEGRDFIGIEQDAEYIEIARRRIEHWQAEAEREAAQLELQFD